MSQVQILSARPKPLETLGFQGLIFSVENNPHTNAANAAELPRLDALQPLGAQLSDRVRHVFVHRFPTRAARNSQSSSPMPSIRFSRWWCFLGLPDREENPLMAKYSKEQRDRRIKTEFGMSIMARRGALGLAA